jgi:hypothetical protein
MKVHSGERTVCEPDEAARVGQRARSADPNGEHWAAAAPVDSAAIQRASRALGAHAANVGREMQTTWTGRRAREGRVQGMAALGDKRGVWGCRAGRVLRRAREGGAAARRWWPTGDGGPSEQRAERRGRAPDMPRVWGAGGARNDDCASSQCAKCRPR